MLDTEAECLNLRDFCKKVYMKVDTHPRHCMLTGWICGFHNDRKVEVEEFFENLSVLSGNR